MDAIQADKAGIITAHLRPHEQPPLESLLINVTILTLSSLHDETEK